MSDPSALPASDEAAVSAALAEAASLHGVLAESEVVAAVVRVAAVMRQAWSAGGKVLVFGNGGSAAESQHFAAELVGRFAREREAYAAVALSTDTSALTAIGNDYGFARVFARQIEALGRPGDVVIGLSTSGSSPNVVAAFEAARARGLVTVGFTGRDGGRVAGLVDVHVHVANESTARVQEAHLTLLHAICAIVDRGIAGDPA